MINQRQRTAIKNPCTRAADAISPRFVVREGKWSTILTINK